MESMSINKQKKEYKVGYKTIKTIKKYNDLFKQNILYN